MTPDTGHPGMPRPRSLGSWLLRSLLFVGAICLAFAVCLEFDLSSNYYIGVAVALAAAVLYAVVGWFAGRSISPFEGAPPEVTDEF